MKGAVQHHADYELHKYVVEEKNCCDVIEKFQILGKS